MHSVGTTAYVWCIHCLDSSTQPCRAQSQLAFLVREAEASLTLLGSNSATVSRITLCTTKALPRKARSPSITDLRMLPGTHLICLVVQQAGDLPGKDVEQARLHEVHEGVEVEGEVCDVLEEGEDEVSWQW